MDYYTRKEVNTVIAIILVVILVIFGLSGIRTVGTGNVGVVTRFGKIKDVRPSGITWIIPWPVESVKSMKVTQTKIDAEFEVSSRDMQTVKLYTATQYSIDPSAATEIYAKFLNNYESGIIVPTIAEAVQSVSAEYSIEEVVSKRSELSHKILERAKEKLELYGINVIAVDIVNHDFSDAYEQAVEQKKVAEQATLRAQQELEKAQIDAEKNRVMSESMDENTKYRDFINKWDGKLPSVIGGDKGLDMLVDPSKLA